MITIRIVTPRGVYLAKQVNSIYTYSIDGALAIYPEHLPVVLILQTSKLVLKSEQDEEYAISGGTLSFSDNVATLLTDSIESKDEIDVERALKAKIRAEENLSKAKESFELKQAEMALSRAINRLNIKKM